MARSWFRKKPDDTATLWAHPVSHETSYN